MVNNCNLMLNLMIDSPPIRGVPGASALLNLYTIRRFLIYINRTIKKKRFISKVVLGNSLNIITSELTNHVCVRVNECVYVFVSECCVCMYCVNMYLRTIGLIVNIFVGFCSFQFQFTTKNFVVQNMRNIEQNRKWRVKLDCEDTCIYTYIHRLFIYICIYTYV